MAHRLPLADIKFLADFHAYCLTRGDDRYQYVDIENCALTCFMRDTGRDDAACGVHRFAEVGDWQPANDSDLLRALVGSGSYTSLATRIEALLADAPRVVSA